MQEVPVISIVDDDESIRLALSSLIRSMGWTAHVFESAQAFLDSGLIPAVSCLISDIQMPGMTGLELQQRLLDDGHRLPIVFITAFGSEAVRQQAMNQGAAHFLLKPLDPSVIEHCLHQLVNSGSDT
ncbi:response regulator [Burkholderia sp. Ac-20365]|jgi:FixJ family two-component response regulator|uniref:response regulator transcription factor n=1 Tax=Burkholderia sp. Ac-20365 TaxID=2703897 RepID=UPI00197B5CF0|nr:response regulator [Burkholderia sp. Ac-20365]MBN3765798.1 response regulator [Burkholderia sp. Ac-20365]